MKSLQLTKPHLLVVVGIPGSGKTFFAEQFSKTFNAPYVHIGEIRSIVGDDKIAQAMWDYTIEQLILTKQTILVEGGGNTRTDRLFLANFAHKHGYEPLFIWVQTEQLTAQFRATKSVPGQKEHTLMSNAEFENAFKKFENLRATEKYMVISGKHTYASQAKNVLKKLVEPRSHQATLHPKQDRGDSPTQGTPRPGRISIN